MNYSVIWNEVTTKDRVLFKMSILSIQEMKGCKAKNQNIGCNRETIETFRLYNSTDGHFELNLAITHLRILYTCENFNKHYIHSACEGSSTRLN